MATSINVTSFEAAGKPLPDDDRAALVRSRLGPTGADGVVEPVGAAELAGLVAEGRTGELVARALEAYHDLLGFTAIQAQPLAQGEQS